MFENREGGRMARFFFHVKNDKRSRAPFARLRHAKDSGHYRELAKETGYEGFALSVTDEQGNEVAYMPIGEAAN
jgi:hypothetical protein